MYTWLFDVLLDRSASADEKARARAIMAKLMPGVPRRAKPLTSSLLGDLIREVLAT